MDLNQLAVFVRVIDSGSFTKAAKFLHQPKSRVSRRIAALERELGVALLYRTTRQLSPTEEGRLLYQKSRDSVYALEGAAQSLSTNAKEVSGRLRLTAAEDVGSCLLGKVISEMTEKYPKVSIDLHLANDFVDLVKDGMDLAIRIGELEDANLKSKSIGVVSFILVASPGYLRQAPAISQLADLADHPSLVFLAEDDEPRWKLKTPGKREESVKLQVRCRSNNPKVLLDLALAGKGVALIPEFLCLDSLKKGELKRLLPHYSNRPTPIRFVWPAQSELSPKVRAFIDFAGKSLASYFLEKTS